MRRKQPFLPVRTRRGMTLAECLAAVAVSSIVLAGLADVMRVGALAADQGRQFEATRAQAEEVLDRIARAIDTADPKTHDELKAMYKSGNETSGTWLNGKKPNGAVRIIRYDWRAPVLNEIDEADIPRALLQNVTQFSFKQGNSQDAGLVEVRMTVKSGQHEQSYAMVRRLGGAW